MQTKHNHLNKIIIYNKSTKFLCSVIGWVLGRICTLPKNTFVWKKHISPGLIVGAIIRYGASTNAVTYLDVDPVPDTKYNQSVPPDILRLYFPDKIPINAAGLYYLTMFTLRLYWFLNLR